MKYEVKVNGKIFEVEVERIQEHKSLTINDFTNGCPIPEAPKQEAPKQEAPKQEAPKQEAPKQEVPKQEVPKQEAPSSNEGEKVISPMPGTILKLLYSNGDTVKSGDVILILEAMKMENEIVAPKDGTINYKVNQGDTIDTDAILAVIQ